MAPVRITPVSRIISGIPEGLSSNLQGIQDVLESRENLIFELPDGDARDRGGAASVRASRIQLDEEPAEDRVRADETVRDHDVAEDRGGVLQVLSRDSVDCLDKGRLALRVGGGDGSRVADADGGRGAVVVGLHAGSFDVGHSSSASWARVCP